jgi:DNA polymerase II small subunit/DNA polymerase delta subunit B
MTALYEISKQYQELAALADAGDEDLAKALSDTMEAIEGEFQEKGKALAMVTLNMDGDIDAISAQIARLTDRKKMMVSRQESLKEYLRSNMERTGIKKISHPLFTITLGKGKPIVVIDEESKIPDEYMNTKVETTPKKSEIAKALKEGKDVPGAHSEIGKSSISIK